MNSFADMTHDEYRQHALGYRCGVGICEELSANLAVFGFYDVLVEQCCDVNMLFSGAERN